MVADVWEKDVWDFWAKSGSSGSCHLFVHFIRKIAVLRKRLEVPDILLPDVRGLLNLGLPTVVWPLLNQGSSSPRVEFASTLYAAELYGVYQLGI